MEETLIDLVKLNYFSDNPKINESQILNLINKRCLNDITISLSNLLLEIDETINSNYVKDIEIRHKALEQQSLNLLTEINSNISFTEKLQENGNNSIEKFTNIAKSIKDRYDEIRLLEQKYQLAENQEKMMTIISNMQSALILENIQLASEQMVEFMDNIHIFSDSGSSKDDICIRLHKYHKTIEDQVIKLFEGCMLEIHWPFISNDLIRTSKQLDTYKFDLIANEFSEHFRNLYLIELPDELKDLNDTRKDIIDTKFLCHMSLKPVCLPVRLLLRPLVQYFRYFFWNETKVNKIGKPEWYMTQVIQWISIHQSALDHLFTATITDCIDVKLEFIRALVIIVMEKVYKDLELTKTNDDLFIHLIEESITMTVDLRRDYDYPESYPDLIDVVCNDDSNFDHWMMLEQRFALKQLDDIFLSVHSWRPLSSKCSKRIQCLESFIGLIGSIKERIGCVSDVPRKARFCQVLLEILENFRLRIVQISKNYDGNTKRCYDIMNVVLGVKTFVRMWRLDPMFIEVHEYNEEQRRLQKSLEQLRTKEDVCGIRTSEDSDELPSATTTATISNSSSPYTNRIRHLESLQLHCHCLFSAVLALYQHVLDNLEAACVTREFRELCSRAEPYLQQSWLLPSSHAHLSSCSSFTVSPPASGMLLVLRDRLHELHRVLEPDLFATVWHSLAHRLNQLLYRDVILANRFTECGALQLEHDLRRNLLPLFIPYTRSPQRFFLDCLDACTLLTLKWGTLLLTKELLRDCLVDADTDTVSGSTGSRSQCPIRALNDLGIYNLAPDVALFIINLRIDPNRK